MAKLGTPESFDFTHPAEWPIWRRRFDRFRVALKLDIDSGEVQVNTFLYAMGRKAEAIYDSFVYDDGGKVDGEEERGRPELDYDTVIAKVCDHFVPKINVIHERACFHKRAQKSVEASVRSLYELAQYCEFGHTKDEQIRDRIVIGISDNDVSQKLQLEPELSLEIAIQIACQSEQIKQQNVSLRSECAVDAMRQGKQQFHGRRSSNDGQWQKKQEHSESKQHPTNSRCNRQHGKTHPCLDKNKKCRRCNKIGHFEVACQMKMLKEVATTPSSTTNTDEMFFLGEVTEHVSDIMDQPDSENECLVDLPVNGSTMEFKIDTRADISVMSQAAFKRLPQHSHLVTARRGPITSPGSEVKSIGKFLATSEYKGKKYRFWITVIKGPYSHNLLGVLPQEWDWSSLLKCDPVKTELNS